MNNKELFGSQKSSLVIFLFHFLLFSYPLLSFLWRRSYPLFTAETLMMFVVLAVLCALLTLLLASVRSEIVNIFSALLVTLVFVVQFNFLLQGLVICVIGCVLIAWQLRTRFHTYSLPVILVLILGALMDSFADNGELLPVEEPVSLDQQLPPVIHIILDSFIGLDGFPPYESSEAIQNEIYSFFNYYNFQVFPRAYSPYTQTGDSIYSALNFENKSETGYGLEVFNRKEHVLESNAQFDALEKLGYHSRIYQTQHLDFCRSNPENLDRCWTYSHPNVTSIRSVKSLTLRMKMLTSVLLKQSRILADLMESRGWLNNLGIAVHDPRIFTVLGQDLARQPDGYFFLSHVLLPHGPFAFASDCSINYETDAWARYAISKSEVDQPEIINKVRAGLYFKQMGCALLSMGRIFEGLKSNNIFERTFIVIHGDHGSLIGKYPATVQNFENLTGLEYRANFSTLFAVKFPNGKFSVDTQVQPLSVLLKGFTNAIKGYVENPGSRNEPLLGIQDDEYPYIYLTGTYPLQRHEINIFED